VAAEEAVEVAVVVVSAEEVVVEAEDPIKLLGKVAILRRRCTLPLN